MNNNKKEKIFKIIVILIAILITVWVTVKLFPVLKNISTKEGQEAFKEKVENSKVEGVLAIVGLQIAQIFLFILPGEPVEILAGMCFGTLWGTVIIMFACFVISTIIFLLVRKYGKKFIYYFCKKEKVDKIENSKWFQNSKKIEYIMTILFLIPGSPKDLLVYVGGILPIKPIRFIIIATFARFPSVISSTIAGENIVDGNWMMSIILYVAIVLIAILLVVIVSKFDKDKIAKEAIKSIRK